MEVVTRTAVSVDVAHIQTLDVVDVIAKRVCVLRNRSVAGEGRVEHGMLVARRYAWAVEDVFLQGNDVS